MPRTEGDALARAAAAAAPLGPLLEIGSYCGKSAVYLGTVARAAGTVLFAVDHHRGSEENQPGWEYHDTELWDPEARALDTLPSLRTTLRRAGLEETVIPVVGRSEVVAAHWTTPLSFVFIDGGHGREAAMTDYRCWSGAVRRGGTLAIHDVFPDPAHGGRPPFEIYCLALASGQFEEIGACGSLRVLRRL
ncbi:MAG: class I SAM-dependent methyltransferase [Alphaproteobacteria bacterium]